MILAVVVILIFIGLLFVFESSLVEAAITFGDEYYFLKKHLYWLLIGLPIFLFGLFLSQRFFKKISPLIYFSSLILLLMVFIPGIGREFNGAKRWVILFGQVLQPIEFVKISLISYLASWLKEKRSLLLFVSVMAVPTLATILQPDLGSTLVLVGIGFCMYYVAGNDIKSIFSFSVLGLIFVSLMIFSSDYRRQRVITFLNPELDPLGSSFHIRQITLALGRGGIFGQGIGNSEQKNSFVPEASTDSIFAIIGEETGFIGSIILVSLYLFFLLATFNLAKQVKEHSYSYLLIIGIMTWITIQAILNLAAVSALVPLTGVPLPFVSYGGSALISLIFGISLILNKNRV